MFINHLPLIEKLLHKTQYTQNWFAVHYKHTEFHLDQIPVFFFSQEVPPGNWLLKYKMCQLPPLMTDSGTTIQNSFYTDPRFKALVFRNLFPYELCIKTLPRTGPFSTQF